MSVEENTCHICHNPVGNAHICKKCQQYIHLFCGVSELDEESEGYGQETLCKSCNSDTSSAGTRLNFHMS